VSQAGPLSPPEHSAAASNPRTQTQCTLTLADVHSKPSISLPPCCILSPQAPTLRCLRMQLLRSRRRWKSPTCWCGGISSSTSKPVLDDVDADYRPASTVPLLPLPCHVSVMCSAPSLPCALPSFHPFLTPWLTGSCNVRHNVLCCCVECVNDTIRVVRTTYSGEGVRGISPSSTQTWPWSWTTWPGA
jgi:hypothetical protein